MLTRCSMHGRGAQGCLRCRQGGQGGDVCRRRLGLLHRAEYALRLLIARVPHLGSLTRNMSPTTAARWPQTLAAGQAEWPGEEGKRARGPGGKRQAAAALQRSSCRLRRSMWFAHIALNLTSLFSAEETAT